MTVQNPPVDITTQNNEEVVVSPEELALLDETTQNKIKSLSAQKAHWRDKEDRARKDLEAYKALHPDTPPLSVPAPITATPASSLDAEAIARKVMFEEKRDEYLNLVPEDKRNQVQEIFNSLSAGKNLKSSDVASYMDLAKRAVGIVITNNFNHRITTASSGAIPPKTPPGPTPEQIKMARLAGNDPKAVYGDEIDFSNLHGAERFKAGEANNNSEI